MTRSDTWPTHRTKAIGAAERTRRRRHRPTRPTTTHTTPDAPANHTEATQ